MVTVRVGVRVSVRVMVRLMTPRHTKRAGWLFEVPQVGYIAINQPEITNLTINLGLQVGYQAGWISQVGYCIWPVWCAIRLRLRVSGWISSSGHARLST